MGNSPSPDFERKKRKAIDRALSIEEERNKNELSPYGVEITSKGSLRIDTL